MRITAGRSAPRAGAMALLVIGLVLLSLPLLAQQPWAVSVRAGVVPKRARVSQAVSTALLLLSPKPLYPQGAIEQGLQGTVQMYLLTDQQGNVRETRVISGRPLLGVAAVEAVKKWKYRPFVLQGVPVEMESSTAIEFRLEGGRPVVIVPTADKKPKS